MIEPKTPQMSTQTRKGNQRINNSSPLPSPQNNCVSPSFHPEPLKVMSEGRNMADRIPKCLAFHANCCALHHINTILKTMGSHIETICKESSTDIVEANTIQLDTILSQGTVFYTCSSQDLTQEYPQGQDMGLADRKTYIWWVLKRYEDMMQLTKSQYSGGQKEKTT